MFEKISTAVRDFFTPDRIQGVLIALLILLVGFIILKILAVLVKRFGKKRLSQQGSMLIRKGIYYVGSTIILVTVLQTLGLKLTALLGAAGIIGIALGFASQTSVANLISGLFLISEKPFAVGDVIKVGETTGVIISIDLLSVKIRTFDNRYIRIPNEKILNSELTNITRFPIRRLDVRLGVAYKEDVKTVRDILMDIAAKNPYCLDEPEPILIFTDFGDSALEFLFGVWFAKTDYILLKNSIMEDIKERFDAEGIEIPFPHRTIYTGSATGPLPVRLSPEEEK
jgi:small-conductance mechanosensitive channel